MIRSYSLAALGLLAATAVAQTPIVVPPSLTSTEATSSTAYPWNTGAVRIQYIYDAATFTSQSINAPILINQLRWRANGNATCTGRTYGNVQVSLSTCPVDHLAVTNSFAGNRGADEQQVFSGAVTVAPIPAGATPNAFYVTVALNTPFLYDANNGDLTVEITHDGAFTGGTSAAVDLTTTTGGPWLGTRVWSTNQTSTTAASVQPNLIAPMEVAYTPSNGLFAGFSANVTAGPAPLQVQFTDSSFSSAPGGVTSWAWDFDGDNVVDSNQQNPTFTYTGCGDFNVTLTVNDGVNPASTLTRTAYVRTDEITASFTSSLLVAPNVFQFTDTTTPAATAWAWDFNNDGIVDSTAQNPAVALPLCQSALVRLTATRNCRAAVATSSLFTAPASLTTLFAANNGLSANATVFLDVTVTNPQGINICGMDHNCGTTAVGTPFTATIYVTDGSYVGKDNNIALWRQVATSSGFAAGNDVPAPGALSAPLYLAPGSYGLALNYNVGVRYTGTGSGTTQVPYSNADLTVNLGAARSTLFNGGSFFSIRQWNGTIHYDTATLGGSAGYGFFGPGCPSTLGITNLVPQSRPQFGQTLNVNLNNLPLSAALLLTGFSNTSGPLGPLPTDLTPFGAPGCSVRVSPDASLFLFGANNAATWSFNVPNQPSLLGLMLYNQALVLDPAANGLGGVMSDAAALLFGN